MFLAKKMIMKKKRLAILVNRLVIISENQKRSRHVVDRAPHALPPTASWRSRRRMFARPA